MKIQVKSVFSVLFIITAIYMLLPIYIKLSPQVEHFQLKASTSLHRSSSYVSDDHFRLSLQNDSFEHLALTEMQHDDNLKGLYDLGDNSINTKMNITISVVENNGNNHSHDRQIFENISTENDSGMNGSLGVHFGKK